MTLPSSETLTRFANVVGDRYAFCDQEMMRPYLHEWRGWWVGKSPMVLRPGTTEEVSRILSIANETHTAIVPQSGNTGLVGGQIPYSGQEIILSLDRMTAIRSIDPVDNTMTVEAGVILKNVQEAADSADRLYPLSLAAEGSCRIGGNLATNAGGLNVLAYGNARDLCLGLEVVLADGRIWNGLRSLRKDNTGYDLKDMFIGSEGTLGIITAAVLKLFPRPMDWATAFISLSSPEAALELMALAQLRSGGRVTAIELLPRIGFEFTMKHFSIKDPFPQAHPWYVILELSGPEGMADVLTNILGDSAERGIISDATIAQSQAQRNDIWFIREAIVETQRREGGSMKHDVSVPISKIPLLIERGIEAVLAFMPNARPMPFGHMGDGNLHFNVSQPVDMNTKLFLSTANEIAERLYGVVIELGGSISAEHGIGRAKRDMMKKIKSPVELQMMKDLKRLFDPNGILNPFKVLPD